MDADYRTVAAHLDRGISCAASGLRALRPALDSMYYAIAAEIAPPRYQATAYEDPVRADELDPPARQED